MMGLSARAGASGQPTRWHGQSQCAVCGTGTSVHLLSGPNPAFWSMALSSLTAWRPGVSSALRYTPSHCHRHCQRQMSRTMPSLITQDIWTSEGVRDPTLLAAVVYELFPQPGKTEGGRECSSPTPHPSTLRPARHVSVDPKYRNG